MSWIKLIADQRLWSAILAAGIVFLWHSHAVRGIELELAAEREKKQKVIIEYRERESVANNDNISQHQESINGYRKKLDDMRRNSDIAIRVCKADETVRAVRESNSTALAATSSADDARFRETIFSLLERSAERDAWVKSCAEFVNRGR